ncbi:MAG: RagB/SusD family nutrient uptake outer membrane protein [Candidatus Cryptobacteroides sp.]
MKQIKIYCAAVAVMAAFSSCSSFLEEDLKSSLAPDNTYTSSMGFETGTTGLYSIARSEYNTWGESGAYIHNGACPYEALQIGTDICDQNGAKDGSLTPFANLTMNSSTQFVKTYWQWAYNLIASANEILEYSEKNTNWDYPTDKALYQAEARFFRAYAYRTLIYLYGDVPYVETIQKPFVLNFTRTPKDEVLGHIIDDLTFATENLPENPDNVKTGKLTKWAAYHLLSEMYLLKKDYSDAKTCAKKVIDCGYFSLVKERYGAAKSEPGDAFSDMFIENNQNRSAGNTESIWVMQFQYNTVGGGTNSDDWTRRAWNPQYFNISGFALADSLGGRGLAQISPMKWWMGTKNTNATDGNGGTIDGIFDDGDMRNSNYNIKRNWYYNNPDEATTFGKKCNITDATWSTGQLFPAITKFFFGKSENLALTGSYKDRMKFRLAETYLLLAEACLGEGDAQGAADAVNVVRRRAKVADVTADKMDLDFLLDERIRELVGEECRRFTLVRTGKLIDRVKKYNTVQKDIIKEHHVLWPIPQTIIDSNRDVEFPQNEGY